MQLPPGARHKSARRRQLVNAGFTWMCRATALVSVVVLGVLLVTVTAKGLEHLDVSFFVNPPSPDAERAGMGPAIWGSIWICAICGLAALPIGVGTAIFLEEFKPRSRFVLRLHAFLQLNIANLAGVPSIVYGIIGLSAFANVFGVFGTSSDPALEVGIRWVDLFYTESREYVEVVVDDRDAPPTELRDGLVARTEVPPIREVTIRTVEPDPIDAPDRPADAPGVVHVEADQAPTREGKKAWYYLRLPFGRGVLAGGLTLMLVILPIVIVASQEAIRAVPNGLREGALATGATKWQMIWRMTLPASVPGIMTGSILAMSRAIGEAAPILVISSVIFIRSNPSNLMDEFTAMPLQIYRWAGLPQDEFRDVAATGIIILLAVLLSFNALAVFIRHRFTRPLQ